MKNYNGGENTIVAFQATKEFDKELRIAAAKLSISKSKLIREVLSEYLIKLEKGNREVHK